MHLRDKTEIYYASVNLCRRQSVGDLRLIENRKSAETFLKHMVWVKNVFDSEGSFSFCAG